VIAGRLNPPTALDHAVLGGFGTLETDCIHVITDALAGKETCR
jgi:hypothetical protein